MLHLFVCFNAISYHIAERVAAEEGLQRVIVIHDPARAPRSASFKAWHMPFTKRSHQFVFVLAAMGLIKRAHVPHMRLHASRLTKAVSKARSTAFIDDGLDTLRRRPKNIDPANILPGTRYYTFARYASLPDWLNKLDIRRVGQLQALAQSDTPVQPFPPGSHVLIESPGLDVAQTGHRLIESGVVPVIISHPAPEKRGPRPTGHFVEQTCLNLDAAIAVSRGVHFYIGESMTLVIPLYSGGFEHNFWTVCLSKTQTDNLIFASMLVAEHGASNAHQ